LLESIEIENLAVIKKASVDFGKKLNVFTGETGAGKSILLHGLQAVLGVRVSKDIVRNGCEKACVTAKFGDLSDNVKEKLKEYELIDEDDTLIIRREIFANGKSSAKINFHSVTLSVMREIGVLLVDIHGQHDNQILLSSDSHMDIIDSFGNLEDSVKEYKESFHKLQDCAKKLGKLRLENEEAMKRQRYLTEQYEEISALGIDDIEEEKNLENEYQIAQNAEDFMMGCKNASSAIESSDVGAVDMIINAIDAISDYVEIKPELSDLLRRMNEAKIELADISDEIKNIADDCYIDEERFEYIKSRLSEIYRLKKKYCCDFQGLIQLRDEALKELENMQNNTEEIERLSIEKKNLLIDVSSKAKALSVMRQETAEKFSKDVTAQLEFLNMPNVEIKVSHIVRNLTLNGMDKMEIMISANLGPLKPISKIASGGELSRIMLAIKAVIADKDSIPTLIFDEIDTGVSGKAAQKIGLKLKEIGRTHQVLCVTHLSQIAVMADTHLLIEKNISDNSVVTEIKILDENGRIEEISRIMGGENPTESVIKAAKESIYTANALQ
jgi:DNA repair protein RecN (Recombination protein N)